MSRAGPSPEQAIILVGGLGTRLRPLTYHLPKALLPVVNRPLLSFELEWLRRAGVRQVILTVTHQAEALQAALGEGQLWDLELVYVKEEQPLDTAGALKNAARQVQDSFWALNGDLIFDFDPLPMVSRHRQNQALLSLCLRRVEDISPFGLIQCDREGRVTAFREKTEHDPTGQNTVNAGVYLMEPEVLDRVPSGQPYSNERQLFPELLEASAPVWGFRPDPMVYWIDVGRLDSYLQANHDLLGGALPWVRPEHTASAQVSPQAKIVPPCNLAEDVIIEAGARVGPYVSLGPAARVEAGARLAESIVHAQTVIAPNAILENVVVAGGETVPAAHVQREGVICSE